MALLSREALLATTQLPTEDLAISTGTVRVRGLSGKARDDYEASVLTGRGDKREVNLKNLRAKLIVKCLVDETGALMLGDGDVDVVGNMPAADADRIFDCARRLSGMTKADVDELGKDSSSAS